MLMMCSDIDADYISPSSDEACKEHLFLARLWLLEAHRTEDTKAEEKVVGQRRCLDKETHRGGYE